MQSMQKAYVIIMVLLLSGCVKCPDSISFHPLGYYHDLNYELEGISFGTTWYLPVDNNTVCSTLNKYLEKMHEEQSKMPIVRRRNRK